MINSNLNCFQLSFAIPPFLDGLNDSTSGVCPSVKGPVKVFSWYASFLDYRCSYYQKINCIIVDKNKHTFARRLISPSNSVGMLPSPEVSTKESVPVSPPVRRHLTLFNMATLVVVASGEVVAPLSIISWSSSCSTTSSSSFSSFSSSFPQLYFPQLLSFSIALPLMKNQQILIEPQQFKACFFLHNSMTNSCLPI